jgi:AraC-like DNA-binding protein
LIQFGEALDHGITTDRLGDGIDGEISEYWERLFDLDTGHWKEEIQDEYEAFDCNLLIINCVEVHPKFRGRRIGSCAIPGLSTSLVQVVGLWRVSLHAHLDGEVRLGALAEECRLSVSHFARSFKKSFGMSAHRYLILQRVEIAKGLISQTQNSLAEIALLAGFSDQSKLCRTFASVVGAPPGKWKRENSGRKGPLEMFEGDLGQACD